MARGRNGGDGHDGHLCLGSKRTFVWGIVAGVVLSIAVCRLWCGGCGWKGCGHGMWKGCAYGGQMAPAPEGQTKSK
jgi:hypothetical protein